MCLCENKISETRAEEFARKCNHQEGEMKILNYSGTGGNLFLFFHY